MPQKEKLKTTINTFSILIELHIYSILSMFETMNYIFTHHEY